MPFLRKQPVCPFALGTFLGSSVRSWMKSKCSFCGHTDILFSPKACCIFLAFLIHGFTDSWESIQQPAFPSCKAPDLSNIQRFGSTVYPFGTVKETMFKKTLPPKNCACIPAAKGTSGEHPQSSDILYSIVVYQYNKRYCDRADTTHLFCAIRRLLSVDSTFGFLTLNIRHVPEQSKCSPNTLLFFCAVVAMHSS